MFGRKLRIPLRDVAANSGSSKLDDKGLPSAISELDAKRSDGLLFGRVEILSDRVIAGWAFERGAKAAFVTCSFDGEVLGSTLADLIRSDVAAAGSGFAPMNCGFELKIDISDILSRCDGFEELGNRLQVDINARARVDLLCDDPYQSFTRKTSDRSPVRGLLEGVQRRSIIGWCVASDVDTPVSILVFIDDILQAEIDCSSPRPDLNEEFGHATGGFHFVVPQRFCDGRSHTVRCLIPSRQLELQGSPLEIQLQTEAEDIRSEIQIFTDVCARAEAELARARESFEQYVAKKGAFVASYRYFRSDLEVGELTRSRLRRAAFENHDIGRMSIILPTHKSDLKLLAAAIDSVQSQTDPNWELIVSDSASVAGPLRSLVEARSMVDERIKFVASAERLGISDNSNQALRAATGAFVGFLDHDDTLAPEAVSLMRLAFATGRHDLIYSDEDKINTAGEYVDPHFKGAMNLDLLLCMNYMCHFVAVRRDLLERIGGFRGEFDGAQDWDMILRVVGLVGSARVGHIPRVLYHWRMTSLSTAASSDNKSYAVDRGVAAVNAFLRASDTKAEASKSAHLPYAEVTWHAAARASLCIIIPTKDKLDLVMHCLLSLRTTIEESLDHEIIIVDNASSTRSAAGLRRLSENDGRIRIVNYSGPFNYSAINNCAAGRARSDYLLLLNNDVFFTDNGWARKMLGHAMREDVGAVGLKLLYPDNTVQHCGVVVGNGGVAGHAFSHLDDIDAGYFARAAVDQQVSAVTGACLMVKKSIFDEVGGFESEGLPIAFNDIDLCLRIQERGYRNILVASCTAYHAESKSRGAEDTPEKIARFGREIEFMKARWKRKLTEDRHYSPNFDAMRAPYSCIDLQAVVDQEFAMVQEPIVR